MFKGYLKKSINIYGNHYIEHICTKVDNDMHSNVTECNTHNQAENVSQTCVIKISVIMYKT